ncbi:MAG: DUF362 domain-containing protein [Deltaproteobacteria bacterium]|nr:DUF362 domain-containing protein [Deltaproteobacteria bacterium]
MSIRRASYDCSSILRPLMFGLLNRYGGTMPVPCSRAVIKPNVLSPAGTEVFVLSHPLALRTAVEFVASKTAKPCISDSPAMRSFERILNKSGFTHEAPLPGKLVRILFPRYWEGTGLTNPLDFHTGTV